MQGESREDIWMQSHDMCKLLVWMVLAMRKEVLLLALQPNQHLWLSGPAEFHLQSVLGDHAQPGHPVSATSGPCLGPSDRPCRRLLRILLRLRRLSLLLQKQLPLDVPRHPHLHTHRLRHRHHRQCPRTRPIPRPRRPISSVSHAQTSLL